MANDRLGAGLRVLGSALSPQAFQANVGMFQQEQAGRERLAAEERQRVAGEQKFTLDQAISKIGLFASIAKENPENPEIQDRMGRQIKGIADNIDDPDLALKVKNIAADYIIGGEAPAEELGGGPPTQLSTVFAGTGKEKDTFGKSIQGRSQDILINLQQKLGRGKTLTSREELERSFAEANLTAPRDTVQTDPVTGEKSIVTIRPELPAAFTGEAPTTEPSITPERQPRITKTIIDKEKVSKKARIKAESTLKAMKSAKKSVMNLIQSVTKDPQVTGMIGAGRRVLGGLMGQVGLPSDVAAATFETRLETARSELKEMIDVGKFSDEDRKRLEKLVKGTGVLDSPQATLAAYHEILNLADRKIEAAQETLGITELPEGATEEDIKFTMRKHKMTRKQVLEKLRAR